jgi:hypothetical protein
MGRTIASITQTWHEEEAALRRFERALRKEDQILLDELLVFSRLHLAEASYASNLYPLDMYLIAILLEVYKKLKSLEKEVHGGKEEPAPELIKEARFLEMLEDSFRQTLERPLQTQAVPAVGMGNSLGRIPATVSLQKSAARPQAIPVEANFAEEQEILSAGSAAGRAITATERTRLSQVSTFAYPPCALTDPAVAPSYASFEDAP